MMAGEKQLRMASGAVSIAGSATDACNFTFRGHTSAHPQQSTRSQESMAWILSRHAVFTCSIWSTRDVTTWMDGCESGTAAVARGTGLAVYACGSTLPTSSSITAARCCGTCWNAATSRPAE